MNVSSAHTVIRFGVFEADLRAGDLRKKGVKIKIQDLPFRALGVLLARPHEVVTREELRLALWPQDVFVDFDRAISSAIKRLRDALGDSADNPIFIETVDRRGYRWIAPVAPVSFTEVLRAADSEPPAAASDAVLDSFARAPAAPNPNLALVYAVAGLVLLAAAWKLLPLLSSRNNPQRLTARIVAHPANQEARDLYLQGRYYWNKRTPADLEKALDYFTQAIVHDPGYSDAYVGLADCYNLLREYSVMRSTEAYPRALAAARKAVELDENSSQAHASLAFASFWGMWDSATADREFLRAIELDPNNATAHHWYAPVLGTMGRYPDALTEIERAQALDPTSKAVLADKGIVLYGMGRKQDSIALLRELEKAEPEFVSPHRYLKRIYLETADYPDYLAEAKNEAALTHNRAATTSLLAIEKSFATGGAHAMFLAMRREQQKMFDEGKLSPYTFAETCELAGNHSDALKYLNIAYQQHDDDATRIPTDPIFEGLRSDPAVRQIVSGMAITSAEK